LRKHLVEPLASPAWLQKFDAGADLEYFTDVVQIDSVG